eukprot:gene2236-2410_t
MSHNVAFCLVLKSRIDSKIVVVSTVHANWNHKKVEAQLWQNKTYYEQVQNVVENLKQHCSIIMAGDFNSTPNSKVYQFFSENLTSAYTNYPNKKEAPVTCHGDFCAGLYLAF